MAITDFINKFGGWTEKYLFYDGEIELRYDPKDHVYLRVTDQGELEEQEGVTQTVHILDKSDALVPWGCKMMSQKLLRTIPVSETAGAYIFSHEQLENWVLEGKSAHQEKLEEAGAIGHIAHSWVESFIKLLIAKKYDEAFNLAQALPQNEASANACIAALDWMAKHNVQWIETERKIYSRKYRYAGTMDGLARVSSCGDSHCQGCRGKKPWVDRLTVVDWKTSNYLYLEYLLQTAAYEQAFEEEHGVDIEDRWVIRLGKDDAVFDPWHLDKTNFPSDFGGFVMCLDLTRRVEQLKKRISDVKAGIRAAVREEKRIAREAKDALLAKERAEAKVRKQEERVARLAHECEAFRKTKGLRKPTCKTNEGGPCVSCTQRWQENQINPPKRAKKGEGKPIKVPVAKVVEKKVDKNAITNLEAIANRPKDRPKAASVNPANGSSSVVDRISLMLASQTRSGSGLLGRFR